MAASPSLVSLSELPRKASRHKKIFIGLTAPFPATFLRVDRILDMFRTVLDITGGITAAMYVARSEGTEIELE